VRLVASRRSISEQAVLPKRAGGSSMATDRRPHGPSRAGLLFVPGTSEVCRTSRRKEMAVDASGSCSCRRSFERFTRYRVYCSLHALTRSLVGILAGKNVGTSLSPSEPPSVYRATTFPLVSIASALVANMTHFVFCSPAWVAVLFPDAIRLFLPDYQA